MNFPNFFDFFRPLQASHVDASMPGMTQSDLRKLMDDLSEANREKDDLKQKCHEMEIQINLLKDEKINITSECEQLQAQVREKNAATALDTLGMASARATDPIPPSQEYKPGNNN